MQSNWQPVIVAPITSPHSPKRTALRISGADVPILAEKLFQKKIRFKYEAQTLTVQVSISKRDITMDIEVFSMPKGFSYTHEPSLELHYPSNANLTLALLEKCYQLGAKPAEPGEFTKRAFLNGRINLSQAQSVASLVASTDQHQRKEALKVLSGQQGDSITELKEKLFAFRRNLEADIDFPEEPDVQAQSFKWSQHLQSIEDFLNSQKNKYKTETKNNHYLRVLLLGPANAGKSSLIAALLPGSYPIISHTPGTTLDLIPYPLLMENHHIQLFDSPGLKSLDSKLDQLSLQQLYDKLPSFDAYLILHPPGQDFPLPSLPNDRYILHLQSKSDLIEQSNAKYTPISAFTHQGLSQLNTTLLSWAKEAAQNNPSPWKALEQRLLTLCLHKLPDLQQHLNPDSLSEELAAYELDELLEEINDLIYGEKGSEALLDSIFKDFCIGK